MKKMRLNSMDDPKEVLLSKSSPYSNVEINEFILELERINPTFQPANSDLINGVWERVNFDGISNTDISIQAINIIRKGASIEVSAYIYTYIYIYVCIYIYVYIYICMYIYIYIYISIYTYKCRYRYVLPYICIYINIHTDLCVYICSCI
jgi:hypothetical protein